jgi:hypothetical protein
MLRKAIVGLALAACCGMLATARVSAETSFGRPDHFLPVPVSVVSPDDAKKDRNGNGIVCGKVGPDGRFHSGPDDTVQDDIVA